MFSHINRFSHKLCLLLLLILLPLYVSSNTELPDPTRPATYLDDASEPVVFVSITNEEFSWKLSAIRISKEDKTAIVNGKLVRVGDDVGSARILEINALSVVINHEDRKLIVKLFKNKVIKEYKSQK